MKRKLRNWAIGFLMAVVAFLGLLYFLMDFAVDMVLEQLVPDTAVVEQTAVINEDKKITPAEQKSGATNADQKETDVSDATKQDGADTGNTQSSQTSDFKQTKSAFDYQAEVTTDRSVSVENAITLDEKVLITSIVLDKFNSEELGLFRKLTSGGLSIEEKKKMRALFLKKLTPEQYDQLIVIAKKYGVSQGKTYEEHQK